MKSIAPAIILLLVFISFAHAQQPSGSNRRRGLDQLDLLTIRPAASSTTGPAVEVDLDTFQLLEPLVRHCRELEVVYKATIIDGDKDATFADSYEAFVMKALAIHRSIFLIRKIKTLSPEVTALVDSSEEIGKDVARTAGMIRFANDARFNTDERFEKEASQLFEQYEVTRSRDLMTDGKRLLAVILRRLNANFGRLKVAG